MSLPSYIDAALLGKHSAWRYLVGFVFILFMWVVVGSIATAVLLSMFALLLGVDLTNLGQALVDPNILGAIPSFLILNVSFIFFFAGTWLAVVLIHRRPLRTLITGRPEVSWRRMGVGFVAWLVLGALGSLVEYLIWPETFSIQFEPLPFLVFAILALILTPMQTTSEELFFRGYLPQAGSLISRNAVFLSLLSGVVFSLPHFANPEVAVNGTLVMLNYFILGVFLTWISLKDGTIELAIGMHAANNLFAGMIVTYPQSALQTPAIFYTTHFDPLFNLVVLVVLCAMFYLYVFGWRRQVAEQPVEHS
jgi:hypothetical protein